MATAGQNISVGIDVGSTTVKVVVLQDGLIIFKHYERHYSQVRQKTLEILERARQSVGERPFTVAISGSAGLGMAKAAHIPFIQEVFATSEAVRRSDKGIDIVIELGGEDAKIIFLTGGLEERMNGSCAGGTGAFIDQMATLLDVSLEELDALSLRATKRYPIASRCGVFAKSDIQPLLNQNAAKEDIAASIFQAVVDQTITGLAQGRRLEGRIAFLGGPLHFFKGLQQRFTETLRLSEENAVFPGLGQYAVAIGAAHYAQGEGKPWHMDALTQALRAVREERNAHYLTPLFASEEQYAAFCARHARAAVPHMDARKYTGDAYLGIDCGSTTTKLVLMGAQGEILYSYYGSNRGNPVDIIRAQLCKVWACCGSRIRLRAGAVTGYGEQLIQNAFDIDAGLVETMAHFKATRFFCPDVDFILDIGGQDIKCFRVKNDAIDSIMLNEACSSGCGSFIETFARALGYDVAAFAKLGLFARHPVDLGSRCTVFMNSSVKQAQKEGAGVADISAGLSMSVVKNAIYKVIRARSAAELGENVVVQGGTFYNDAVLRSFEMELGRPVIRPAIAGLMGAYGAALHARDLGLEKTAIMPAEALARFTHRAKTAACGLCANKCTLRVNQFGDGKRFISGNKCERPLLQKGQATLPNMYAYKLEKLLALKGAPGPHGKIGIPMGLNMYENLPFWHAFFTQLGFEVVRSDVSSVQLYNKGRYSIPSDTVCYPAKLMHGHIENLLEKGVRTIFYPCLTYNFDEGKGDNHYNCPVVAYYPELLQANVAKLAEADFMHPFWGLHRRHDFVKKAHAYLAPRYADITRRQVQQASDAAYEAYDAWMQDIRRKGREMIDFAEGSGKRMIVLAGRPYHVDPEINHGIDRLISSLGIVVLSEDCVCDLVAPQQVNVLNQWTYHARLYNAAKYCTTRADTELVQLVSFGCGIDAITTDEVRDILESKGKLYTELKIDDISNNGPAKIRIRSLLGAIAERQKGAVR
nr:acyl-CoA dehydratase activase-related protein [Maliibacterium massiliense]